MMNHTPKILCIDDSKTQLLLYKQYLKELNFEVEVDNSSLEALEKIKNGSYDLVLLDLDMPGLNGVEVLKKIKKDADLNLIPVMIISSLHNRDSISEIFRNGACDFLKKPFYKEEFLMRVRLQIEHLFFKKYYLEHHKN